MNSCVVGFVRSNRQRLNGRDRRSFYLYIRLEIVSLIKLILFRGSTTTSQQSTKINPSIRWWDRIELYFKSKETSWFSLLEDSCLFSFLDFLKLLLLLLNIYSSEWKIKKKGILLASVFYSWDSTTCLFVLFFDSKFN